MCVCVLHVCVYLMCVCVSLVASVCSGIRSLTTVPSTLLHRFRSPEDTASIAVPQQTSSEYGLLLLFSVDEDENILTRERIQVVRDMELAIMNAQGFSDVCLLPRDSQV